jgi:predicted esterase
MVGRRRRAFHGAALALMLLGACRQPTPTPSAAGSVRIQGVPSAAPGAASARSALVAAASPSTPRVALEPLASKSELSSLSVPGFRDAVVSMPVDTTQPQLVVFALHGNFDRPEWQCEVWRRVTKGAHWVLCPRGVPRRDIPKQLDRWEWGSVAATKAEMLAALAALRARYADHVAASPVVFSGFSLGAILGARLIQDPELDIGVAVLVEGGYQGWTPAKAKALKPRLSRLLFACGQTECRNAYRYQLEQLFSKAGVAASMVADIRAGHTYDEPVASLVAAEWQSLLVRVERSR